MIYARLMVNEHYYKTVRIPGDWPTITVKVAQGTGYLMPDDALPVRSDTRVDFLRTPYLMEGTRVYKCSEAAALELVALPNWHSRLDEPKRPPESKADYVPDWAEPLD